MDTLLYPCRDGSDVKDWKDCKDAGKHPDEQVERIGNDLANVLEDDEPEQEPVLGEGCDEYDDYCDLSQGCESPTVDCIDDVNLGDDGVDAIPNPEFPALVEEFPSEEIIENPETGKEDFDYDYGDAGEEVEEEDFSGESYDEEEGEKESIEEEPIAIEEPLVPIEEEPIAIEEPLGPIEEEPIAIEEEILQAEAEGEEEDEVEEESGESEEVEYEESEEE